MEKVTVIIPTYKNRGGLRDAVISATNQKDVELEIIVVDDNSPDSDARKATESLMSEFKPDNRIIYIKHAQNKNGAAARNTGINVAKGDFIAFLDDDDRFLPGKLARQVDYLNKHLELGAVYCYAGRKGKRYGNTDFEGDATKQMLMLQTSMYTPTLMFRRESLLAIKGFDESFRRHQDYDLMLRFFHAGYKIGCLKEILTEIGTNTGENSQTGQKLEETKNYFFEKFQPYIDEIETTEPGFGNKVYAKHYAGVFLTHIKTHKFRMAIKVFNKYFFKSPKVFMGVVNNSLKLHIKGIDK